MATEELIILVQIGSNTVRENLGIETRYII